METTILMSGGIDSTACANYFLARGSGVRGVFVDYGQAARSAENRAVHAVAAHLKIPLTTLQFESPRHFDAGEIIGRNAFLIFAALMGTDVGNGIISLGIHGGTEYYDCSEEFVDRMSSIIAGYSAGRVVLDCPFIKIDKPAVYEYARQSGLPLHLTYSCERGTLPPCGRCLSCRDLRALEIS